jgi:type I restriction enzyme S subunit
MATKSGSVDPSKFPEEIFDLYSIPAFDRGEPEIVAGSAIGSAKQVVRPGDVLLSRIVPHIRRSWIVGKERGRRIIASGEWIVFRSERANPNYLRQVLVGEPFHAQFMNTVAGVGGSLLRARPAHVAKIVVPLPPLAEQRRIAEVLDRAEALRTKRRAALAQLDSLTQSIFLDLFGDPATNPRGWSKRPFGEVCETRLGKMLDQKQQTGQHLRPYLRNANVQWFRFDVSEVFKMDFDEKARKVFRLKGGDLLICEGGEPGRAAVWRGEIEECYYQKALHRARPRAGLAISEFLAWQLWFLANRGGLGDHVTSATIAHLTGEKLSAMKIPLPPIELQREFAHRVTAVEKLKTAQRASLAELDALFATLQHRAFRGER